MKKDEKLNFLTDYNKPIIIKKGQSLTIIDLFNDVTTIDECFKREFILEKDTTLEYLKLSTINEQSNLEIDFDIQLKENAKVNIHLFELGLGSSVNKIKTKLNEKDENIFINSLVKLNKSAKVFNSFELLHEHPHTFSDIKIRHLLDDNTKAEFEALTVIENKAIHSKAFQDSKTILLSDDAIIKARPHLEILTDELEASHGAVTGGLDKKALYYLRSRGLSEDTARDILIDAFCLKALEYIEDPALKNWLNDTINKE